MMGCPEKVGSRVRRRKTSDEEREKGKRNPRGTRVGRHGSLCLCPGDAKKGR